MRNKRRAVPVVIIMALAVFAISLTAVLTNTLISSARERNLGPLKKFSMVIGKNSRPLGPGTLAKIENHPAIAGSLPFIRLSTRVDGLFGSEEAPLFGVPKNRRKFFLRQTGLKLAGGRLPDPAKNEVALHLGLMMVKKITLGDFIGNEVDEKDWLDGKFKVVGQLYGPISVSLLPYEYLTAGSEMNRLSAKNGRLVFAGSGKKPTVEKYLRSLEDKNIETRTFGYWNEEFKREFASMDTIIWTINGILIVVLSLALVVRPKTP